MRKILYVCAILLLLTACDNDSYQVTEDYEKAVISAIECYNEKGERADNAKETAIATPTRMVIVKLNKGEDITKVKVCLTISSGALITPSLSVGFQDFTAPKVYQITSPGGTIVNEWTIMIFETK